MAREIDGSVVVVTGAASGIGRATAVAFARRGASVVAGDLDEAGLAETARLADILTRRVDVRDEAEVVALGDAAEERHGRIDTWVNNAGAGVAGRFEDIPPEVFRKVVETDFFGTVYGARRALVAFRRNGDQGTLVDVASIVGEVATPLQSAYNAAKFAVRGFSDTIRQELQGDPGIHVCTVEPGPVATAFWDHLANLTGRNVTSLPGAVTPERVADAIVSCVTRPRAHVHVGWEARVMSWQHRLAPALTEWTAGKVTPPLLTEDAAPTQSARVDP